VIGLTGGIGSGKSTVARILDDDFCPVFYTDIQAMIIQHVNPKAVEGMKALFGDDIYMENGRLDRRKLGNIVFSDKAKLQSLNELIHPLVKEEFDDFVYMNELMPAVAIESAILVQSGFYKLCDFSILVSAQEETRIQRVMQRDNLTAEQVRQRIQNQMPESEVSKYCKYTIDNRDLDSLRPQIEEIWKKEFPDMK